MSKIAKVLCVVDKVYGGDNKATFAVVHGKPTLCKVQRSYMPSSIW